MLRQLITPQSEAIRAIFLEDSPCCGVPHRHPGLRRRHHEHAHVVDAIHVERLEARDEAIVRGMELGTHPDGQVLAGNDT